MKTSKYIWLKTAKVTSHKPDATANILRTTVKLEDGDNFTKFLKYINTMGFLTSEPPTVVKVLVNGEVKHENEKYQKLVKEALNPTPKNKEDYKAKYEDLLERLEALESGNTPKSSDREILESKAKELGINFRSNIGDAKLLEKIQDVTPEFNIGGGE